MILDEAQLYLVTRKYTEAITKACRRYKIITFLSTADRWFGGIYQYTPHGIFHLLPLKEEQRADPLGVRAFVTVMPGKVAVANHAVSPGISTLPTNWLFPFDYDEWDGTISDQSSVIKTWW